MDDSAVETAETRANGRFRPGTSGKPAGGPKGAKKKTTLLAEEAMEEKVGAVAAYAKMSWPQQIDAMWDAEEAERKAAAVPAETESAEARAAEAADPADDGAGKPDGLQKGTAAVTGANYEINREIQAGDALRAVPSSNRERWERPAAPLGATSARLPVDHSVPQPYVDMTVEAPSERLIAARAHYRDLVRARTREFT